MTYNNPHTLERPEYGAELMEYDYSFYELGVWIRNGELYISTDSGCSCYGPWESHTESDLTGPLTVDQVEEEATSLAGENEWGKREVADLIVALRAREELLNTLVEVVSA